MMGINQSTYNSYVYKGKPSFFMWCSGRSRTSLLSKEKDGCNKGASNAAGFCCGALIQLDGWEIKDDYPW